MIINQDAEGHRSHKSILLGPEEARVFSSLEKREEPRGFLEEMGFQQGFKIKEGLLWEGAGRKGAKKWDSQGGLGLIA